MEKRCVVMVALLTVLGFTELWHQASAEGCFWISSCQNAWFGGCGTGYVPVDRSNDCKGLCSVPKYATCPLLFTRFLCCSEGQARESTKCSGCPNKLDSGNEWLCCSDCSEPAITDAKSMTGYCMTDAFLSVQRKPRELFKWTAGAWKKCSGKCKKASRTREVKCLRSLENAPRVSTVVKDDKCLPSQKPSSQEPCTPQSCVAGRHKRQGLPTWAIVLISFTVVAAVGGLAFMGLILYKRRMDNGNHGFVYVMLDSY